jgi:tRNA pseudouridine55 synthase
MSSIPSGILNVDKPGGCTSHDVVARVRRLTGIRRVGHAGTLDPMATGVLLVCIGQATRVAEFLAGGTKRYVATVRLGIETDTLDAEGKVVAEHPVPELTTSGLVHLFEHFLGVTEQVPPAFSAIKQGGAPVYRKARRGESVELPPRSVTIHSITLLDWTSPEMTMEVSCEPGTYIRSLARDIGSQLGCGASMIALRRTRSGRFDASSSVSLEQLEGAALAGSIDVHLLPIGCAFGEESRVQVGRMQREELAHGRPIALSSAPADSAMLAVDEGGEPLAVIRYRTEPGLWWPDKVFVEPDSLPEFH